MQDDQNTGSAPADSAVQRSDQSMPARFSIDSFENDILFSACADASNMLWRHPRAGLQDWPERTRWRDAALWAFLAESRRWFPFHEVKCTQLATTTSGPRFEVEIPPAELERLVLEFLLELLRRADAEARVAGAVDQTRLEVIRDVSGNVAARWGHALL